jgi:hypothetical protein
MALLAVQDLSGGSGLPTFSAAAGGGDTIATDTSGAGAGWDLGLCLVVRNTDAATKTVTVEGLPGVVVPATTGFAIIPVARKHFGAVRNVTYSAVTGVSVAAIQL